MHYGEILSIYGVSVDSIFSASLKGAGLIRVPFSDTVFPSGTVRSKWWVPPPAHTDSLFFLGITGNNGVLGYVHGDSTIVVEQDLYEPNDTVPQLIDLDAPPPFAAYPTLVFTNPALAFEALPRDVKSGSDWYRLNHAQTEDLTIVLTAPQIAGTFFTFLTDSLVWDGTNFISGPDAWSFGPKSHNCHGAAWAPSEALGDSTIVAFKNLPAGTLDAIAGYTVPGRYGLTVIAGYQSELPADKHEDDNSCNAADLRGARTLPYRDTLSIVNPHDIDWIRFTVPSVGLYRFRLHAFTGVRPDSLKDLDLYLVRVPSPGTAQVQVVMADTSPISDVNRSVSGLAAGDYYLVMLDYRGTTTHYEICVAADACPTAFPAPSAAPAATKKAASSGGALGLRASPPPGSRSFPMTNGTVECPQCHTPLPESSRYCSVCGTDQTGGAGPPSTTSSAVLLQRLQRAVEGKYRIERILGKGGMGAVFLAHDLTLEREVAIKVLPPDIAQDEQVVRRFQQEAKTSAKLDHPHIIPIYRVESEGGLNYFVMKYVAGTSLEDVLERQEPLARRLRPAGPVGGRVRARTCAPTRRRTPRREAREHHVRPRRPRGAYGLRDLEGAPGGHRVHRHGDDHRHAPLHGSRAGQGCRGGWPRRPVLARRRGLPHDHGRPAVRRGHDPHRAVQADLRAAPRRQGTTAPTFPSISRPRFPGRWRKTPPSGSKPARISPPPCGPNIR